MYSFYLDKYVNAPMMNCFIVNNEFEMFKDWTPMVYKSNILYQTTQFQKFDELGMTFPWPFQNRVLYVSTNGESSQNSHGFVVMMRTSNEKSMYHYTNPINRDPQCVAVDVKCQATQFEKVSEN